jgi:nitrite reductase/ring-hydroxylating ferredoxin subunit/predicted secreted protein
MMADKGWHKAVRSSDLQAGDIFPAAAGRDYVLVARLQSGEAVAFASRCPHQGTELEGATVWDNKVRCPKHQYLYDPRDGANIHPTERFGPEKLWKTRPGYLPTFTVREREGWVWVFEEQRPPPASYDPSLEEPPEGAELEPVVVAEEDGRPTEAVKVLKVAQGASFELRLPMNPLPGNAWHVEVVGDLLEVVEEGLSDESPPRWRARIQAHDPGEDEVECRFLAPWDREPSELRRYVVQVVETG